MNNKFMPGMLVLSQTISPGRSTAFDYGNGYETDKTYYYYDMETGTEFFFEYIVDGTKGSGWYEVSDSSIYYSDLQNDWILLE